MKCPFCTAVIQADFVVCPHCGKPIAEKCPKCGKTVENTWKKCPYCQSELPTERMKEIQQNIEEAQRERAKKRSIQIKHSQRQLSLLFIIPGILIVLFTLVAFPFIASQSEDIKKNPENYTRSYDSNGLILSPEEKASEQYIVCSGLPFIIGSILVIVGVVIRKTK